MIKECKVITLWNNDIPEGFLKKKLKYELILLNKKYIQFKINTQ